MSEDGPRWICPNRADLVDLTDAGAPGLAAAETIDIDGTTTFFVIDLDQLGADGDTGNPTPAHDDIRPPSNRLHIPDHQITVTGTISDIVALHRLLESFGVDAYPSTIDTTSQENQP
ncbi:MAG: hypothetical protein QM809_01100 [Gordonia sp. (in: high G+C Gram-positive bacteria)]|uniref:hypothetical protein n=1 Tax=Gordonia sp. (in: high G+C Gram-positive bacteria) TaxID=84139 RepID=UPI0039E67C4D